MNILNKITRHLMILCIWLLFVPGCTYLKQEPGKDGYGLIDVLNKYHAQLVDNKTPSTKTLDIVKGLPTEVSLAELEEQLKQHILPETRQASRRDVPSIREAIVLLRNQPHIVQSLINVYDSLPKNEIHQRYLTIQLVGELQRLDGFDFLRNIAWQPMPSFSGLPKALAMIRKNNELMIQIKSMQGIAYMRDGQGLLYEDAVNETLNIILNHPVRIVRIAAIDAYMWNHKDSGKAASKLYEKLPSEYHKYVERPRFYRGMNRKVFDTRLVTWRRKWAEGETD